jgi:hypothetical protein
MTSDSGITRACDRCNKLFKVPVKQPNRTTCFSHRGAYQPSGADPEVAANKRAEARRDLERKIARSDLQREIREITVQIERADDSIALLSAQVSELQILKSNMVARHALLTASIEAFTHLIDHTEASYLRELNEPAGIIEPKG